AAADPLPMNIPGVWAGAVVGNRWSPESFNPGSSNRESFNRGSPIPNRESSIPDQGSPIGDQGSRIGDQGSRIGDQGSGIGDPGLKDPIIRPMIPLGQFRDTFIIAVDDEGVAIIDQHVAHERVLFELITERLTSGRLESQRLLTPILL